MVIEPGGTMPPTHNDDDGTQGDNTKPFVPTNENRKALFGPYDWLQISSGLQTSNLNNGRWNMRNYAPWYNDKADYNTSAKSFYDYLSRLNYLLDLYRTTINQLLRREIITGETTTIKMFQDGNWEDRDDITLTALVKISKELHQYSDGSLKGSYDYPNAIFDDGTGIYAKDFTAEINDLWKQVKQNMADITNIYSILSGAWTNYWEVGSYTAHPKNTFTFEDGGRPVKLRIQDVHDGYNVQVSVVTGSGTVGNSDLSKIELGHGDHTISASYVFGVDIGSGPLANCDFSKMANVQQNGNNIWNIKGNGNKWTAYCSAEPNVSGNDFVVAIQSYANGDNTLPSGTMGTSNINLQFYVPKKK